MGGEAGQGQGKEVGFMEMRGRRGIGGEGGGGSVCTGDKGGTLWVNDAANIVRLYLELAFCCVAKALERG